MRVLFVSSEVFPLAKTGGLADVSHALPATLRGLGVDVRLLVPGYPRALERAEHRQPAVPVGPVLGFEDVSLVPAQVPGSDVPVWLVDCPLLFARDGDLYLDLEGREWPDNHLRYAVLGHVAARLCAGRTPAGWRPDLVHANDWHAGLAPLLCQAQPASSVPSLFTIHNMAFQGVFAATAGQHLGLTTEHLVPDGVEYYGNIYFLKAGIRYADKLTTVSPTYAREIMCSEFGFGLEGMLAAREADLTGILNGVDYRVWEPSRDPFIAAPYCTRDLSGKRASKQALQAEMGLEVDAETPVFGYMSRLTEQKMADQVLAVAPAIAERFGQLVVVAQGEHRFETGFRELSERYPGRIAAVIGYAEDAAHRLLAGADVLLAPARFEPCGLTQLYALRYGTVPIVCRTGGLADTVVDADRRTLADHTATGIYAEGVNAAALTAALARAVDLYRQPLTWRRLCETAMAQDFSWSRSAGQYHRLYMDMTGAADGDRLPEEQTYELEPLRA